MDALLRSADRPRRLLTRLTTHAQRDSLKMPLPEAGRVLCRLEEVQDAMRTEDRIYDAKPLRGQPARWRLRVGSYRAAYAAEDGKNIFWVLAVGHRPETYQAP